MYTAHIQKISRKYSMPSAMCTCALPSFDLPLVYQRGPVINLNLSYTVFLSFSVMKKILVNKGSYIGLWSGSPKPLPEQIWTCMSWDTYARAHPTLGVNSSFPVQNGCHIPRRHFQMHFSWMKSVVFRFKYNWSLFQVLHIDLCGTWGTRIKSMPNFM